jgi:hypothetical protein
MYTIYITLPIIKRQYAMSHPKLNTVLAFVKHLRLDRAASVRVWGSNENRFVV